MEQFKAFFEGGRIYLEENLLRYRVTDRKTLFKVQAHYEEFPLQSTKLVNFIMWSEVLDMMVAKEHLTEEGLLPIVAIKSHFPNGLNEVLSTAFPELPFVDKPDFVPSTSSLDPNWIAGFVNADGSFTSGL